ncbi:MAG TPA: hypothetical protein VFZ83_11785 [Acidimicrobiia bacterium]|nr:hypothetical protein [Acidimicrobiia bacterium]
MAIGVAIGLSVRAELGLAPWDVFHQGVADATGLSFGAVVVAVGLVVLLSWVPLGQRPGIGTVVNTLTIGFVADATLALLPEVDLLAIRVAFLLVATLTFGIGGGLYIGAGLGPGPRDGLMTGLAARGHRLWVVRTTLELSVLVAGWLLGGTVGVGTVLIALAIGPLTHAALARFHLPVHAPTAEVLGE